MYKLFLILFLSITTFLNADDLKDKVEIFATHMETKNNIVTASGDVAVVYKDYFLTSSRAVYDKTTGELELFDNVRANQLGEYKTLGNYARLNIKNKERSFQPFYMLEEKSQVWIGAEKGVLVDTDLDLNSGVVSSCNPTDPLWKMEFSSSDYNTDSKWLNLYNTRLYIYDIPVFYTPWFGHSLDKTRRTGLLKPTLGYSSDEGFLYQQPIYIAEQDWWDLELTPQIRTNRGKGLYSTFRFTDSNVSNGELKVGYFKEDDKYFVDKELANQNHRGFNFKYENSDFLNSWTGANFEGQSGIYADIGYMNDVDYINLAANNSLNIATATQVLSRVNMFYNTDNNYFGAYFKYYQDLTKESNADTIQQLPILHYHHYLETLFDDHVLYNVNAQTKNIHREKGMRVTQSDVNVPVSVHTSLFEEYLDITFTTNLYLQHSAFKGSEIVPSGGTPSTTEYENGYIAKNDNKIDISSQQTKAYEDFTHVINFGTSYAFDGGEMTDGFYEYNDEYCENPANAGSTRCEFYEITDIQNESQYFFSQYFYDSTGEQILYHRLAQAVVYSEGQTLGDLENELEYRIMKNLHFYNNMFYNHKQEQFSKIYNTLAYNDESWNLALSHLYKDTFLDVSPTISYKAAHTSYLTTNVRYAYNSHYSYNIGYDYDLNLNVEKRKEIGFLYTKRCWDFGIRYVENNRPVLQQIGGVTSISSIPEKYIYFTITLKPFMQSGENNPFFAFKLPEDEGTN